MRANRLGCPVADHPGRHVVDRQKGSGRRIDRGHFLEHQRRVKARQPETADVLARVDGAKSHFPGLAEGVDREYALLIPARGIWGKFSLGKLSRRLCERQLLVAKLHVHCWSPSCATGRVPACFTLT